MSVKIKGIKELQSKLEGMMSARQSAAILNKAVNAGGDIVKDQMTSEFDKFKDKGWSKREITRSNARANALNDDVSLKVGLSGPKSRKSLLHLNEFGYNRDGKFHKPRGYGAMQRSVTISEKKYYDVVAAVIKGAFL